ncbi:Collagen alpha-1(XXVII) chain [Frankliniella fusca]|uniref:Collagen alpha-1(XXVII) chain n=1 Tax=Frankliniella fusca TaxID=407009 RepID=A0AAE1GU41_9NEOP|nr:Collagen alpha-1(XXVII) chain [Frankliniella fusca]
MVAMIPSKLVLLTSAVALHFLCVECSNYVVWITDNGPIVQGGLITFQAELLSGDGSRPVGSFKFYWKDNGLEPHKWTEETKSPRSTWNVTYPANKYYPGEYEVQVNIDKWEWFGWVNLCSKRASFNITALLNGRMDLIQDDSQRSNFISNATEVEHKIVLSEADNVLLKNATEVQTFWFVDCTLYGVSNDLSFNYTYGTVGHDHDVEALVVVSFDPIIPSTTPAPTTTTSSTTTTPTTPTPSSTPSTSASPTSTSSTTTTPKTNVSGVLLKANQTVTTIHQGKVLTNFSQVNAPYICLNSSIIPPDRNKTYGYFHRHMNVKAPVNITSVKGTNWLQQDQLLDLQIVCSGSGNFSACNYKAPANYNYTGNETCVHEEILETCQFNVSRFFSYVNYTVIVIVSNDVSKVVYPVKVMFYKVQKHAQLSVIVVPVGCSLLAVIMIVFGVAYYVQRKKRFTVEVADFDFGQGYDEDMEYKTFRERLRESVVNSFNRDFGVDGEGNVWSPSRKYGSMQ